MNKLQHVYGQYDYLKHIELQGILLMHWHMNQLVWFILPILYCHGWRFGVCDNETVLLLWHMALTAPRFIDHVAPQFIFSVRHEGLAQTCCEKIFRICCRPRSSFRDPDWHRVQEAPMREIPGAAATQVQGSVDSELIIPSCTGHLIAGGTRHGKNKVNKSLVHELLSHLVQGWESGAGGEASFVRAGMREVNSRTSITSWNSCRVDCRLYMTWKRKIPLIWVQIVHISNSYSHNYVSFIDFG